MFYYFQHTIPLPSFFSLLLVINPAVLHSLPPLNDFRLQEGGRNQARETALDVLVSSPALAEALKEAREILSDQ